MPYRCKLSRRSWVIQSDRASFSPSVYVRSGVTNLHCPGTLCPFLLQFSSLLSVYNHCSFHSFHIIYSCMLWTTSTKTPIAFGFNFIHYHRKARRLS